MQAKTLLKLKSSPVIDPLCNWPCIRAIHMLLKSLQIRQDGIVQSEVCLCGQYVLWIPRRLRLLRSAITQRCSMFLAVTVGLRALWSVRLHLDLRLSASFSWTLTAVHTGMMELFLMRTDPTAARI